MAACALSAPGQARVLVEEVADLSSTQTQLPALSRQAHLPASFLPPSLVYFMNSPFYQGQSDIFSSLFHAVHQASLARMGSAGSGQ